MGVIAEPSHHRGRAGETRFAVVAGPNPDRRPVAHCGCNRGRGTQRERPKARELGRLAPGEVDNLLVLLGSVQ